MKVLLYSHSFYPAIGGLETVSLTLAKGFIENGIDVKVVTKTSGYESEQFSFKVIRNPLKKQRIALVKWADIILFNGASLALQPWILLFRKPFIWIHIGYQVSCIDGLGWADGKKAPLKPLPSFLYHYRLNGWKKGIKDGGKLLLRQIFAKYIVTKNIAITKWMLEIQPLPRQIHIYNPFPANQFSNNQTDDTHYDFLYLGRIVSEKGVATLLKAFAKVYFSKKCSLRLLVIGDGDLKQKMEQLAKELTISKAVIFTGKQTGQELRDWINKCRIAIIPSEWYEPMGVVALELMAAGKNMIVAEKGGLKECVEDAGLYFPNGDEDALAVQMIRLLEDDSLRKLQVIKAKERVNEFLPSIFISKYITLLKSVVNQN
ncbi:MAG: glycosyltransferase family 4 protein [Ilyomonas sp.]